MTILILKVTLFLKQRRSPLFKLGAQVDVRERELDARHCLSRHFRESGTRASIGNSILVAYKKTVDKSCANFFMRHD